MNAKSIGYWITMVLFCIAMGVGGFADVMQNPTIMASMKKLGNPDYFATIIGFLENCRGHCDTHAKFWTIEGMGSRGIRL